LTACRNPLDHLACDKRQPYEPTDVLLADVARLAILTID